MTVKLNNNTVLVDKTDAAEEDMPSANVSPIIIPPLTEVEVISDSNDTDANYIGSISFTGRVYDA